MLLKPDQVRLRLASRVQTPTEMVNQRSGGPKVLCWIYRVQLLHMHPNVDSLVLGSDCCTETGMMDLKQLRSVHHSQECCPSWSRVEEGSVELGGRWLDRLEQGKRAPRPWNRTRRGQRSW